MNGTSGREFLGLHPFFAPKNGWNIKQKSLYFIFYVHFFSFVLRRQKKRNEPKKRKPALIKRNSKVFYQRFCRDKLRSKSSQNTTVSNQGSVRAPPLTSYGLLCKPYIINSEYQTVQNNYIFIIIITIFVTELRNIYRNYQSDKLFNLQV